MAASQRTTCADPCLAATPTQGSPTTNRTWVRVRSRSPRSLRRYVLCSATDAPPALTLVIAGIIPFLFCLWSFPFFLVCFTHCSWGPPPLALARGRRNRGASLRPLARAAGAFTVAIERSLGF